MGDYWGYHLQVDAKACNENVKWPNEHKIYEFTKELVEKLNEKIFEQDSVIRIYIKKDTNYLSQVKNYADIQEKHSVIIAGLEKDVNNLTTQNNNLKKGIRWVAGGFLGTLISFLTFSLVK